MGYSSHCMTVHIKHTLYNQYKSQINTIQYNKLIKKKKQENKNNNFNWKKLNTLQFILLYLLFDTTTTTNNKQQTRAILIQTIQWQLFSFKLESCESDLRLKNLISQFDEFN